MADNEIRVGFIGAGGIARPHVFAISSLSFYYNDAPRVSLDLVCSGTEKSRRVFADRYGFREAAGFEEFVKNRSINTVYILGPNKVHADHLQQVLGMQNIRRIYIEKPICATIDEEQALSCIAEKYPGIKIQAGFQYLFMTSVRSAIAFWRSGKLGKPVHFEVWYYHGDYLKKEYRDKRTNRLTAAPEGGAMADLGSHALSLAIAFISKDLQITGALQGGSFGDVTAGSDLFSSVSLFDDETKAVGTVSASRVSSGTGDMLSMEIFAEKGALRFSSHNPDYFEYHTEESGLWVKVPTGSNYGTASTFPSAHVPPGWLRPMIHAHYVFLKDNPDEVLVPDLQHGLAVQRLVRESAEGMAAFRENYL